MISLSTLFAPPPVPMGISFFDDTVTVLALRRNGHGLEIVYHDRQSLAPGIVVDGAVERPDAWVSTLNTIHVAVEERLGFLPPAIIGIDERQSFLQVVSLPPIKEHAKQQEAVRWEVAGTIPDSIEDVHLSYTTWMQQVGKPSPHDDIMVGTAPRRTIQKLQKLYERAGGMVAGIDLVPLALVRALDDNPPGSPPTLVVSVDERRSLFVLTARGAVLFTSSVGIGFELLRQAVARELPDEDANVVLREMSIVASGGGNDARSDLHQQAVDAIIPALTDISQQVREYLSFYRTHAEHAHGMSSAIERVLLCGSGASLPGLADYLSLQLKLPVIVGDPWAGARTQGLRDLPNIPHSEALAYASAIGLALYTL